MCPALKGLIWGWRPENLPSPEQTCVMTIEKFLVVLCIMQRLPRQRSVTGLYRESLVSMQHKAQTLEYQQ